MAKFLNSRKLIQWISLSALLAANVLFISFSIRQIKAEDLGYHIRFGLRFIETGDLVRTNQADLYTLPDEGYAATNRPEAGPGSWYDGEGNYRFTNPSWLSQLAFAAAWKLGGEHGLGLLLLGLTAALSATLSATMLRLGLPAGIAGCLLMLVAMASFPRLTLRPELLGYLVLALQVYVLAGVWRRDKLTWRGVATVVALQLVFVNVHSYFILGLAVVGTTLVGRVAMWHRDKVEASLQTVKRLALTLGLMLVAGVITPWGWRVYVLVVETMQLVREHKLATGPGEHPWSLMGDMKRTSIDLGLLMDADIVMLGFVMLLLVGVAAAIEGIVKRQWDVVLVIGGFILLAFSAERNMAVGCMVIATAVAGVGVRREWPRITAAKKRKLISVCSVFAIIGSICLLVLVTTQRLYVWENRPIRFGWGLSRAYMPYGVAEWINERGGLPGNTWSTTSASSSIWGFVEPTPKLQIISNTWAYPPAVMREVFEANGNYGETNFEPYAKKYNVETVIAEPGPFLRRLMRSGHWQPVYVEGRYAVLVRKGSATAERWGVDESIPPTIILADDAPVWVDHLELLFDLRMLDQAFLAMELVEQNPSSPAISKQQLRRLYAIRVKLYFARGYRDWQFAGVNQDYPRRFQAMSDFSYALQFCELGAKYVDRQFFSREFGTIINYLKALREQTGDPWRELLDIDIQYGEESRYYEN